VRRLVERITQDDDVTAPRETLADVDALVVAMREVGMEVVVTVEGASEPQGPPGALAPSQELAVYRIVQESLTNALKHAGASSSVAVQLDWRGRGLTLQVTSRGRGAPLVAARTGADRGAGVRGMTERARLAGGWLSAQPSADGTAFEVTAFVPTTGASSAVAPGASSAPAPASAPPIERSSS
jgi:signal transduction histidine kinase